ncbi:RGS domain-containing protein [Rhizophagus clarus]|uniref:RGS domain-containing protein n=1 Tax=Rhizophagus clarus TaxID=94130 RepID=A0A8H3LHZ2_9GLOM|nr:RGS domain-containing protein [Rhizophagus clarus]
MGNQEITTNNSSEKSQRLAKARYKSYKRDRLPTLQEVLSQHEILCKAYVKDLKKLGLDVNIEYPEYEKFRPGTSKMENDKSKFITVDNGGIRRYLSRSSRGSNNTLTSGGPSRPDSPFSQNSTVIINITETIDDDNNNNNNNNKKQKNEGFRVSVRSNKTNITNTSSSFYNRERPFTRDELRESAERIYFKYIFEGSEKEIMLSRDIRDKITYAIEEEGISQHKRDDPWIYYEAKKEIFTFMESEHFPRFLKCRAFGNMSHLQTVMRLFIGLFFLFLGFSIVLSLIFLDIKPKTVRLWSFIPIFLGVKSLITYLNKLSPLFVLLKISETTFFRFQRIMEPYIYTLHIKKGTKVLLYSLIISIIVTVIFVVVPGYRL